MALNTIPSVDMVAQVLNPSLGKEQTDLCEFLSNHLRNNQTKSLNLFPPQMLSFPLDDIYSKSQVHEFRSPRQCHHFANEGECLAGILPHFFSGCRRRYESCSPHASDHSDPRQLWGVQTTGKTAPERQPTRTKGLSIRTACSGIFFKTALMDLPTTKLSNTFTI